jgi:transient receptor potential cation channel subfamily M protein 3
VPVVVCDGSGRAADLIAFTHKYVTINPISKKAYAFINKYSNQLFLNFIMFFCSSTMDEDVKEQLISTIMKTFAYTKTQADYLFIQLMNCVNNKDLVGVILIRLYKKKALF